MAGAADRSGTGLGRVDLGQEAASHLFGRCEPCGPQSQLRLTATAAPLSERKLRHDEPLKSWIEAHHVRPDQATAASERWRPDVLSAHSAARRMNSLSAGEESSSRHTS